jgi:hypothetical protein
MLRLIADLGVADKIPTEGHVSVQDVAASCAALPEPMLRVLRALAAFRIFQVTADGAVAYAALAAVADGHAEQHASRRPLLDRARFVERLGHAGRGDGGGTPHEAAWNTGRFAYLREHPDEARVFDAMMANFPDNRHAAIAAAYDSP